MTYMTLFIWKDIGPLTDRWHSGGSAVVVAPDLEAARLLLLAEATEHYWDEEPLTLLDKEGKTVAPDHSYDLDTTLYEIEPHVIIFPDSGCC